MRVEYHDKGPDRLGRRFYTLYWWTDYTPSKPYPHERGQVFFCKPPILAPEIVSWRAQGEFAL